MNKTNNSENGLVMSDVDIVVETLPQQEEKKTEHNEIQHIGTSRQVALLTDDHRSVSRLHNLTGIFKKPPGKNRKNFLKMIKLFCDEQKYDLFIQALPSLTQRILGPFPLHGMNLRSVFVNLQVPHDPILMEPSVFMVPHFIKAPEFNKSGMPEMNSSALVQSSGYQQQLPNADVLFLSEEDRQQLKIQETNMTQRCKDWMMNHTNMEHENLQNTDKSVPHDSFFAASGLKLCIEVAEDLTQNGIQICVQESESHSGLSVQEIEHDESTNPESSDPMPEKEPSLKVDALQQCDPNSTTPGQCEERIQGRGNNLPPGEKDSFPRENFQHPWADVAAETEEAMQEDICVDHQVMQIPFLQYSDHSEAAFHPQISVTQIRRDHSVSDDAMCPFEKAGLMLEEEANGTQPFDLSETSTNDVCVDEMEDDQASVLQGNKTPETFVPEATKSNSLEKVQEITNQDLILIPSDMTTSIPCKEVASTHGKTARPWVIEENVALLEEKSQMKMVAIRGHNDKSTPDSLKNAQADGNSNCPKMFDVLQGQKTGKMGLSLELIDTTMDENIKQAQSLSQIQKEMGAVESFMPCDSKQGALPSLDNCQVQKHNDLNFSVAAAPSHGKMEVEEVAVLYSSSIMTNRDTAFPNPGASLSERSFAKVVHSSLPVFESLSHSSQKQYRLTKNATAEVKKGIELNAEKNQLMDRNISMIQSNTCQETLQFDAEKLPVNSSPKTSIDCLSTVSETQISSNLNSTARRCTLHEMSVALVEKETPVQPPLSFIPVTTAASETSAFAGRSTQKFVYRPLYHYSSTSPAAGTDQTVPGDQDMEGSSSSAETTLFGESGLQDGSRRTDGYFKWKYVPSARIDDEVMRAEEDNCPLSVRPCDMSSSRPRRIGLSRHQSVKRLHKSAHWP